MKNWIENKKKEMKELSLFELWLRWDRLGFIIGLPLILGLLILPLVNVTDKIDEALPGCIITEDGEMLSCEVTMTGQVRRFLFGSPEYGTEDVSGVNVDGKQVTIFQFGAGNDEFTYSDRNGAASFMRRDFSLFFTELDAGFLLPEKEGIRCMVVAPAGSREEALVLLDGVEIPYEAERFDWFLGG